MAEPPISAYKEIVMKLYDLGILEVVKQVSDKMFTGSLTLTLNINNGGIGDTYIERVRERIRKK